MIKTIAKQKVSISFIILIILLVSFGLYKNITHQSTDYGSGKGKYADQVDSFSEYLIRNTLLNNVIGTENKDSSLIFTKGYKNKDYKYYSEGTKKYHSNRGIQVKIYDIIVSANKDMFIEYQDLYFKIFRLINCTLITVCFTSFFLCTIGKNLAGVSSVILFSFSGGIALFSSNLYFASWLLFTPLLCQPLLIKKNKKPFIAASFLFSLTYFSVRYEFATTFALMWLLPVVIHSYLEKNKTEYLLLSKVFLAVVSSFLLAVFLHHVSVAMEYNIPIRDASSLIFQNTQMRLASLKGVPAPFSLIFFEKMLSRLNWAGFSFPLIGSIKKFFLLATFFYLAYKERKSHFFPTFLWAAIGYMSWYVFAYQHIMWHAQYDSLLFAATIQLILIFYAAKKLTAP